MYCLESQTVERTAAHLIKGKKKWDFVALIVNITVGAGILGLPSKIFASLGVYSLAAIIGCAVLVLLLILCFAEVGSRFSRTGGPYLYTLTILGSLTSFIAGLAIMAIPFVRFCLSM